MPGNINDIIDVEGSITAINKVADRLVGLDTQIDEMNKNPVVVKVDTGGIDTLAEINASIQKLNEKINQNTQIVAENKSVVQQMNQIQTVYGESTRDNAERLVKLKIELEDVTASMKETQTMMKAGVGDYEKGIRLLAGYTEKQAELTLSIKETQKAIADQVKSNSAFEGSVKSARAEITLLNREQENLSGGLQ